MNEKTPEFEREQLRASIRQKNSRVFLLNVFVELFRPNKCLAIY